MAQVSVTELQTLSISDLMQRGIFWYLGKQWSIGLDKLGFLLYRNGNVYRKYADRIGVAADIKSDIMNG